MVLKQPPLNSFCVSAFVFCLITANCHASTGRTLRRISELLGPTGSAIVLILFVLLVIAGVIYSLKKKNQLKGKLVLFQEFIESPPGDRKQAVNDLVQCFLMGPVNFTDEQADHNAAVLETLCKYISAENQSTLQTYVQMFRTRPAKFGMMESMDMEKLISSLPNETEKGTQ